MSRILLKEIISLKNQKEVYLVQDDKGVFCTEKKYPKVFTNSSMSKKWLQDTDETEPNQKFQVKFQAVFQLQNSQLMT